MSENEKQDQGAVGDLMALFYTREAANEGIEIPLTTPMGERTEHWLRILGADSDAFRNAELTAKREGIKVGGILDEAERLAATRALQHKMLAAVVVAWSFPQPCTHANVVAFFREAPQIADAVDIMVSRRALFFGKRSIDSSDTPSRSSSST